MKTVPTTTILTTLLVAFLAYGQTADIAINLFATDLTNCGLGGCNAYVKVYCSSITSDWKQCGQTAVIKKNAFPLWTEVFTVDHSVGTSQRWRFDVMNQKLLFDDEIGSVVLSVDEFASTIVKPIRRDLNGKGWLNIMGAR